MNELNPDQKYWIRFFELAAIVILGFATLTFAYCAFVDYLYIKEGYEQVLTPGSQSVIWHKKN